MIESFVPVAFSLGAVSAWGTSDFLGGYTSRRASSFPLTMMGHGTGMVVMATVALLTHAPLPEAHAVKWALVAGVSGGGALAIFYRALASGKMGLTAPVAAVLGAAIPTLFAIFTEGLPGNLKLLGFVMAALGIWLISRTEETAELKGLGMAVLAGVGFAGFFMAVKQAGDGSPFWIAVCSRFASLVVTGIIVIARRDFHLGRTSMIMGAIAGVLDITGSVMFVRAAQLGRLDTAVVLTSLYPVLTVLYARIFLKEKFTRWKTVGMLAALASVPLIAV